MSKTIVKKTEKKPYYVRKPYWREPFKTHIEGESMTHQSHADSCDINKIVAQFHRTGTLPPGQKEREQYGDVTNLQVDLTQAHQLATEVLEDARAFKKGYKPKPKNTNKPDSGNRTTGGPGDPPVPQSPPVNPEID